MSNDFYSDAMPYEWFICRAHNCLRQSRNGADMSFMRNLMFAEAGSNAVSHLPKYDKQLEKVKGYMDKALDKFLKRKLTAEEKSKINELKERLVMAYSTSALMQIVEEGLEVTQRFKES